MDQTDQIDFGDLQKEERFKNLAKSLKIKRLTANENIQKIPWSSCSSINENSSDLNYTSSHVSKVDSEILTSSRNLKKLIYKQTKNYSPMATSSVKQFSEKNTNDKAIMPPPSSYGIRTPHKKSDSQQERVKFHRQSTNDNNNFLQEKQIHSNINASKDFSEDFAYPTDVQKEKTVDRHFHRWRVFLNDRGELLIKGSLNNEVWARSKPVAEMLSPTKVKSKFQHTYHLHGSIIDEKNEIPKYIYQKFYNGFPDDWRNVHAIWKNYIAHGSNENFRWPMDVNYSDDDLNSEITDITQMQKDKKFQELSSMEKSTPQRSSGYSSDFQHEKDTKIINNDIKIKKIQSIQINNDENSQQFNEKENKSLHESRNQFDISADRSYSGNLYTALNYALTLKDIIFGDKLTIITQNLLHEKCPKEYVQRVSKTIDYLNNILSVKIGELDEIELKKLINQPLEGKCSTSFSLSTINAVESNEKNNSNEINKKLMRQIITDKIEQRNSENEINDNLINKNDNEKSINLKIDKTCEAKETDSESEIYAGVPKISEKILKSKIYHKRYSRHDSNGKIRTRNKSQELKKDLINDSSVSIIDDEIYKIPSDNERILRIDSQNSKLKEPTTKKDDFINEKKINLLRENRCINDDNKISVSSKLPTMQNNENRKLTIINKENINDNNEFKNSFQRKEINVVQQNLPVNDLNKEQLQQKPRIINTEKGNFYNFKNQFSNSEQKIEQSSKTTNSKIDQNLEEKIEENSNQVSFGSQENPKLLKNWNPLVTIVGKKCHFTFEGTLLNTVGQLMKKKFTTSQVIKRISPFVIETADHQFYKLVGEINNKKHVVPKELLPQCRTGCPVNIDHFCATWLKLKGENNVIVERTQKSNEDQNYVTVTSRGRSILPPLQFWTDERVVSKDGDSVYKSGDPKEKFVASMVGSPSKCRKSPEQVVTTNETVKGVLNSADGRHVQNKVAQKLKFESSESEEDETRSINTQRSHLYTLRKRQRISYDDDDDDDDDVNKNFPEKIKKRTENPKQLQKVRNTVPRIHFTHKTNTQDGNMTLSDDQMSVI
ncbi:MATH and LRR domain-containing protein PFE0570w-like isoform X2 [Leptopilina boulardi]|uniref:MATH and LRR domain-containing protein PFE0570w-like isoform X2 n=1 Tax=Leptopilina boulardi TaxID=63433 RepID=UPI0021F601D0|nr:MATH and LRR domain-containing protein PFE0570w-like isoform X2 [Leptopilina boulardi]